MTQPRVAREQPELPPIVPLGSRTKFGRIASVAWLGERYYFMVSKSGTVSMMPASEVEPPENHAAHIRFQAYLRLAAVGSEPPG